MTDTRFNVQQERNPKIQEDNSIDLQGEKGELFPRSQLQIYLTQIDAIISNINLGTFEGMALTRLKLDLSELINQPEIPTVDQVVQELDFKRFELFTEIDLPHLTYKTLLQKIGKEFGEITTVDPKSSLLAKLSIVIRQFNNRNLNKVQVTEKSKTN